MSMFRTAALLTVIVALMPSDEAQQKRFYERAEMAADWVVTFCDRNGTLCENAASAADALKHKAQFAGGVAYDLAIRHLAGSLGGEAAERPVRLDHPREPGRGTLNETDLRTPWRGVSDASY